MAAYGALDLNPQPDDTTFGRTPLRHSRLMLAERERSGVEIDDMLAEPEEKRETSAPVP